MRLAAMLTACLPVSGFVRFPLGGGTLTVQQGSSRGLSLSPLRPYRESNEGAAPIREALVTSEAFKDLVKRLEEKTQHINGAS
ncbi:unnamed protein product, partial [Hapterophycus canaliculatus]